MFIFFSKVLPPLVYPLGLACLLILAGLVFKSAKRQRMALTAALLILYLSSTPWVSMSLARSLEWRHLPQAELPNADVIVVLAGGTQSADFPRQMVEVDGGGDRVLYAARLYHQGKAPHLLLAGGLIDWMSKGPQPTEDMADLLNMLDVPAEALWFETSSRNTYESAINCSQILVEKGIRRILLVTSAWHMPRSVALFEHQGLEVIPAPADFTVTRSAWESLTAANLASQIYQILPSPGSLELTTRMLKEYLGILVYQLLGRM